MSSLPNEEFGTQPTARLTAKPGLDPFDELQDAIHEGLRSLETNLERHRIPTILWLRCEYVEEMMPVVARQQRADVALRELFASVINLAAARAQVAPGWSPDTAAGGLLRLIKGSVADWLREPGKAQLVTTIMPLISAFLEAMSLPECAAAD